MKHRGQLLDDARSIWQAGVEAVRSERLVRRVVKRDGDELVVCDHCFGVSALGRIAVVGAGKAGAGMASAVEVALGQELVDEKVVGWVNVPADCVQPLKKTHLHAARPAGANEPTAAGVQGAQQILHIVSSLTASDLCLVLISGGGSALLPAPKPPITLEDKLAVTRFLMQSEATITELNAVRKRLSLIKGGGLARASRAGLLIGLVISDIVGDPLDMIASGPTYPDSTTDQDALDVLYKFHAAPPAVPKAVIEYLEQAARRPAPQPTFPGNVFNHIIGNNQTALSAASQAAQALGYNVLSLGSDNRGEANAEGQALAERCRALRDGAESIGRPVCILSGGEPVVRLTQTDRPRKGGRNQQLVLAALNALKHDGMDRILILSGGTDGEDGPTDAAGAWADEEVLKQAAQFGLDPQSYLAANDTYIFFEKLVALLKTGPTHTNVMDLRVALIV